MPVFYDVDPSEVRKQKHKYGEAFVKHESDASNISGWEPQHIANGHESNFPPGELRCLTLLGLNAKQLWEGNKFLPNLRMIKLENLWNLMKTPDFDGVQNLERFMVYRCPLLEEIHPSFGRLEKLVYVEIQDCGNLKMLPPITRSKELETLVLTSCSEVSNSSKMQQNMENIVPHNMNNIRHWFFSGCLRKLDLSWCKLADGDITSSAVWELPNLQQLNLKGNEFVRLDFSLLRLPRLKLLDVSYCRGLVELSELPSSIAVVTVIDIWRGSSVLWLDRVKTNNMPLPDDWYNAFSGILMFLKCNSSYVGFNIVIKQGVDEDFRSDFYNLIV